MNSNDISIVQLDAKYIIAAIEISVVCKFFGVTLSENFLTSSVSEFHDFWLKINDQK
jgi:hypothetical protein